MAKKSKQDDGSREQDEKRKNNPMALEYIYIYLRYSQIIRKKDQNIFICPIISVLSGKSFKIFFNVK